MVEMGADLYDLAKYHEFPARTDFRLKKCQANEANANSVHFNWY